MKGQKIAAISILLFFIISLTISSIYLFHWQDSNASEARQGVMNEEDVRVRIAPGTGEGCDPIRTVDGNLIFLQPGNKVSILEEAYDSNGDLWYKVTFMYYQDARIYTGYVFGAFVTIVESSSSETEQSFEEKIQDFPESYKVSLRILHEAYPKWEFVPDLLDYTWEEALTNQALVGRSMVPANSIYSWKSTEKGAYDWKSDTWYGLDGSSWVAASKDIVAYCMDPRNFLDPVQVFQFELLSYDAELHVDTGINSVIKGSFMDGTFIDGPDGTPITYTQALLSAAERSSVSPYHLASRIMQEMGFYGLSDSISGTYPGREGFYNYYNIGAYATNGNSAIANGLAYASKTDEEELRPWNTRYKAIVGGAIFIGDGYINVGQDTLYYEKFDYVGTPYTHQYMTNVFAPQSEAESAEQAYTEEMKQDTKFVFKIPVYKDMPSKAASKPTSDRNKNNYLNALSVSGATLSPNFSYTTTSYTITVPYETSSISISAKTASSTASVSGTGTVNLAVGTNNINVKVTAQSGETRTYTILCVRKNKDTSTETPTEPPTTQKPTEPPTTPKPTNPPTTTEPVVKVTIGYRLENGYVRGLSQNLKVSTFLGKGTYQNAKASIVSPQGSTKSNSDIVTTGDTLLIKKTNGKTYASYPILLMGDISMDGKFSVKDMLMIKMYILNSSTLTEVQKAAADVDGNGKINVRDILLIKYQVFGKSTLTQ